VWRVEGETHNIVELLDEAFVATELEGFDQMGFQIVLFQYYRSFTEPLVFAMLRVLQWIALEGAVCRVASTTAWVFF